VGNLLMGQTWSNFVDGDATVDCVDWQGPIGQAGFDTPRRTQIRYTFTFDKANKLAISLEKNTNIDGDTYTSTSGAVVDTKIPTIVAAYTYSDSWGHIGVRGMDIYHAEYIPATGTYSAVTNSGSAAVNSSSFSKSSFAGMVSGDVKFGKDDLVFSVMDGQAIDDWGTGFQGAYFTNSAAIPQTVNFMSNLGWVVGYTHVFTPEWRMNVYASGVTFKANSDIPSTQGIGTGTAAPAGYGLGTAQAIKNINDYAVNAFYTVNKNTQFGLEYFYETAKTFGANNIRQQDGSFSDTVKNGRFELVLQAKF
jgi:hypothetical protein